MGEKRGDTSKWLRFADISMNIFPGFIDSFIYQAKFAFAFALPFLRKASNLLGLAAEFLLGWTKKIARVLDLLVQGEKLFEMVEEGPSVRGRFGEDRGGFFVFSRAPCRPRRRR
jgi:hypothetical protein